MRLRCPSWLCSFQREADGTGPPRRGTFSPTCPPSGAHPPSVWPSSYCGDSTKGGAQHDHQAHPRLLRPHRPLRRPHHLLRHQQFRGSRHPPHPQLRPLQLSPRRVSIVVYIWGTPSGPSSNIIVVRKQSGDICARFSTTTATLRVGFRRRLDRGMCPPGGGFWAFERLRGNFITPYNRHLFSAAPLAACATFPVESEEHSAQRYS